MARRRDMQSQIEIDGVRYDLDTLSEVAKAQISLVRFTDLKIQEILNMQALLRRAKNSYVSGLKKEVLSKKSGIEMD